MRSETGLSSLLKDWSGFLPLVMSLAGIVAVLIFALVIRPGPQQDEGAPARLFQLMMTLQLPIMVWFAMKWVPRRARAALTVLALQGAAWVAAIGAVIIAERLSGI